MQLQSIRLVSLQVAAEHHWIFDIWQHFPKNQMIPKSTIEHHNGLVLILKEILEYLLVMGIHRCISLGSDPTSWIL